MLIPSLQDIYPRRRWQNARRARALLGQPRHVWATPITWVPGQLVTSLQMNQNVRDNPSALRAGSISLPLQAALDLMYASDSQTWSRIPVGSPLFNLRVNAAGTGYEFAPGSAMGLIHAASGTDATAGAADMDTVAISGLTATDTLIVEATLESISGVGQARLRNVTDSLVIGLSAGNLGATAQHFTWKISAAQSTTKHAVFQLIDAASATILVGQVTFVTDWTGNWTLALSHVTNSGVVGWRWRVYKLAGE